MLFFLLEYSFHRKDRLIFKKQNNIQITPLLYLRNKIKAKYFITFLFSLEYIPKFYQSLQSPLWFQSWLHLQTPFITVSHPLLDTSHTGLPTSTFSSDTPNSFHLCVLMLYFLWLECSSLRLLCIWLLLPSFSSRTDAISFRGVLSDHSS